VSKEDHLRVVEILVGFAYSRNAKHKVGKDPCDVDGVCRRQPQQRLQIKRVQFANQELMSTQERKEKKAQRTI